MRFMNSSAPFRLNGSSQVFEVSGLFPAERKTAAMVFHVAKNILPDCAAATVYRSFFAARML